MCDEREAHAGPWQVAYFGNNLWPSVKFGPVSIARVLPPTTPSARTSEEFAKATTEQEANARLIAAAPDLLAALSDLEIAVTRRFSALPFYSAAARSEFERLLAQARAAISRAEGGAK